MPWTRRRHYDDLSVVKLIMFAASLQPPIITEQLEFLPAIKCHHHGEQQTRPVMADALAGCHRPAHGKSTCVVAPFFSSTGFSRVVLLLIHAFRT